MKELTARGHKGHPVIVFDNATHYLKLVHEQVARNYEVVVMMNLPPKDAEARCEHCVKAEENFHITADSIVPYAPDERPIFFVVLHADMNDQMAYHLFVNEYKVKEVPVVAFSPA